MSQVVFVKGGALVAAVSYTKCTIWSIASGAVVATVMGRPCSIAAPPSGAFLAVGTETSEVLLFDAALCSLVAKVKIWDEDAFVLTSWHNENVIIAATAGTIARIEVPGMRVVWKAIGHEDDKSMSQILTHSGKGIIISCSNDDTARVWDILSGTQIAILRHVGGVVGGAISPDGKWLFTHSTKNLLWSTDSWKVGREIAGGEGYILKSKFSPDGDSILGAGADGYVWIWDTQTGEVVERLSRNTERILDFVMCQGGKEIVTGGNDGHCHIWRRVS